MRRLMYISLILLSFKGLGQTYGEKVYYLIDSLDLDKLSGNDQALLSESLNVFHSSNSKLTKANSIFNICENLESLRWRDYQFYQHNFLKEVLNGSHSKIIHDSLLFYQADSYNNVGYIYNHKGDMINAIDNYEKSLSVYIEISNQEGIAISYNNIGFVYNKLGDISTALDYFHKALAIQEKLNKKDLIASSLNNIGIVNEYQNDLITAINFYQKALMIQIEIGDKYGESTSYNNIGGVYATQGYLVKALEYYNYALGINIENNDFESIAYSYNNIGSVYNKKEDYDTALFFYKKSLVIREEIEDYEGVSFSLNNISYIYLDKGDVDKAYSYAVKSLEISEAIGFPLNIKISANLLQQIYKKQNKGMESLAMYKLYIKMSDSLNNEANIKATAKQQAKYEYEKQKELYNLEYEKNLAIEKEDKEKQQIITYATATGLVLVVVFLLFVFNRLRNTKKQKNVIEKQKNEVEKQKEIIEETHKDITDSINYAKRLQDAILPSQDEVNNFILNNFILFKPKDVVSGDFYWFEHIEGASYLASADCTGHGVPGAMVSVVCSNALNRSVKEFGIREPSKILDKTRELVIETFAKSGEGVKDGMDIALCAFKNQKVTYSGANNPLWIVRETSLITVEQKKAKSTLVVDDLTLIEFKSDRQPVGLYEGMKEFTQQEIELFSGDKLYFFTDGFADQFGGEKGKKFKYKPFKKFLVEIYSKPMDKQKQEISDMFQRWKGDIEQIDDICIIGVQL